MLGIQKLEETMQRTKFLVQRILRDLDDDELYDECIKHDIPVSECDSRERMIKQIVQHCEIEREN